ncbi:MAG: DivIVA domain-containing protein [Acidimicrobiales bacterium]
MALTPEEIEGRQFPLVANGYDPKLVDRFLTEVAASYRYAMHHLLPGVSGSSRSSRPGGADRPRASHEQVGAEVTDILRAAERVAESMRAEAERQASELLAEAERRADELRSAATAEANELRAQADRERQQAKKVLLRAQEQAEAVVREAERQAKQRLAEVEAEAEQRADRLLSGVRRRAEQMVRAEAAAVERLRAVRDDIEATIVRVAGSETEPVVDLTSGEPVVRIGDFPPPRLLDGSTTDEPAPADTPGAESSGDLPADHQRPPSSRPRDPGTEREHESLRRMVRAAVLRAAEHCATGGGDEPGTSPDRPASTDGEPTQEAAQTAAEGPGGRNSPASSPASAVPPAQH